MIKLKLSYANVAATLALVFSMTSGAMAAKHYLISSTKQISPKVISALKGKTGLTGPAGSPGAQGPQGTPGAPGAPGSAVAFAYIGGVGPTPTVSNAKNVSSVSKAVSGGSPVTGEYCITTTVAFQNLTGITDAGASGGNGVTVSANTFLLPLIIATGGCPASTTAIILTGTEKESKDANFWVSFN